MQISRVGAYSAEIEKHCKIGERKIMSEISFQAPGVYLEIDKAAIASAAGLAVEKAVLKVLTFVEFVLALVWEWFGHVCLATIESGAAARVEVGLYVAAQAPKWKSRIKDLAESAQAAAIRYMAKHWVIARHGFMAQVDVVGSLLGLRPVSSLEAVVDESLAAGTQEDELREDCQAAGQMVKLKPIKVVNASKGKQ
jgi:hypothetical protein